jgi:hypothetical protein
MARLIIHKNTLPYIHPYSIINSDSGENLGDYKTEEKAKVALKAFRDMIKAQEMSAWCVTPDGPKKIESKNLDIIKALEKRMKKPSGDKPPEKIKKRRRIKLD